MVRHARQAAAGLIAAALLGSCGGGDERPAGRLAWVEDPLVFVPDGLPRDRILTGSLTNGGDAPVELRVDQVHVLAAGRRLTSNVRFVQAFGHGLYGPGGPPPPLRASQFDQRRLGEIATIKPGETRPVTVAWRTTGAEASEVELGPFALPVPATTR